MPTLGCDEPYQGGGQRVGFLPRGRSLVPSTRFVWVPSAPHPHPHPRFRFLRLRQGEETVLGLSGWGVSGSQLTDRGTLRWEFGEFMVVR